MTDPVDLGEIARRLGVARETPKRWRIRGLLPPPRWTLNGGPVWSWKTVQQWAERTGRL